MKFKENKIPSKRYIFISIIFICAFFLTYRFFDPIVFNYDIRYIINKCFEIEDYDTSESSISTSRSFQGVLYIYEKYAGIQSEEDYEIAFRSFESEFSCVPIFGCLVPPILSQQCQGSYND